MSAGLKSRWSNIKRLTSPGASVPAQMLRRLSKELAVVPVRSALALCLHASYLAVALTPACSEEGAGANVVGTDATTSDTGTGASGSTTVASSTGVTSTLSPGSTSSGQGTSTTPSTSVGPTPSGTPSSTATSTAPTTTSGGSGGTGSSNASGTQEESGDSSGGSGTSSGSDMTSGGSQGESSGASMDTNTNESSDGESSDPGFQPCPTNGDPCAIFPLGDSITEGFGSSGGGYRVQLISATPSKTARTSRLSERS